MKFNINICPQYLCSDNVSGQMFSSEKCYFRKLSKMVMVIIISIWMFHEINYI